MVIDDASWQPESNIGSYFWGGAAGTVFWVDPDADLVALGLIQLMDSPWPFRKDSEPRDLWPDTKNAV